MSLKETCAIFGAIGAHSIVSAEAATARDPEDKAPEGLEKEWEFVRRSQDIAMFLANALDPTNANHWKWPDGFEALEQQHANASAGALGQLAQTLLPVLTGAGAPASLISLLQGLIAKVPVPSPAPVPAPLPPLASPTTPTAPGVVK